MTGELLRHSKGGQWVDGGTYKEPKDSDDVYLGARRLLFTNYLLKEGSLFGLVVRNVGDTANADIEASYLRVHTGIQYYATVGYFSARNITGGYTILRATATGVGSLEVARLQGAADPYFSMGGSQEFKFYNSGIADLGNGALTNVNIDSGDIAAGVVINVKLDDLATPDDNTDLDFSTSLHGLTPKGTNVGNFLKDDGTWAAPAGGGDVTGPATSTDNEIARQHSTTGKVLQTYTSNPPTISDTGDVNIDGDLDVENIVVSGNVDGKDVSGLATAAEGVAAVNAAGFTPAENFGVVLDAALSADEKWSGIVEAGTAGATLNFGDCVYHSIGDGEWMLSKADATATSGAVKLGINVTVAQVANGEAMTVLLYGKVRSDADYAFTVDAPVFVSAATAGDLTSTAPTGTTNFVVRIVGYGNTADELFFCPDNTYLELA